jgi:hypothetical protein
MEEAKPIAAVASEKEPREAGEMLTETSGAGMATSLPTMAAAPVMTLERTIQKFEYLCSELDPVILRGRLKDRLMEGRSTLATIHRMLG